VKLVGRGEVAVQQGGGDGDEDGLPGGSGDARGRGELDSGENLRGLSTMHRKLLEVAKRVPAPQLKRTTAQEDEAWWRSVLAERKQAEERKQAFAAAIETMAASAEMQKELANQ